MVLRLYPQPATRAVARYPRDISRLVISAQEDSSPGGARLGYPLTMKLSSAILAACAATAALAPIANAHFRLLEPGSWIEESQLGDPQKLGPCGGTSSDPGKATGKVTTVQGGDRIKIRIQETIFHPGFYRRGYVGDKRAGH